MILDLNYSQSKVVIFTQKNSINAKNTAIHLPYTTYLDLFRIQLIFLEDLDPNG